MRARADMDWPEHPEGASEVTDDAAASLRLWLVRGSHAFAVNRRRGRGRNGHARQLLVADAGWLPGDHSGWRGLVTALQRHTVLNALAQLHRSDRLILTMAYLQGHTNLEIARMLHVSARTVSRRLSTALARLEENARNAGIWIASVVLVALGFLSRSQERAMGVVRSVQWQQAAVVVAAGTAVAVIGLAASPTEPGAPAQTFAPAGRSIAIAPPFTDTTSAPPAPAIVPVTPAPRPATTATQAHESSAPTASSATTGCSSNPTDAAPTVPVGSPAQHPTGAPVTHPTAGGCSTS